MGKNNQLRTIKRELRKAKADLASLNTYIEECEETLLEYQKDWSKVLSCFTSKKDENENLENRIDFERFRSPEMEKPKEIKNAPEWLRKIFRKIAQKTHPDKTSDDFLNEIYREALEYVEKEDIQEIFNICDTLNIDYDIDPEYELEINKEKQENIRKRLSEIDKSPAWIWGESYGSLDFRVNFLISILPHYGIEFTEKEVKEVVSKLSENE